MKSLLFFMAMTLSWTAFANLSYMASTISTRGYRPSNPIYDTYDVVIKVKEVKDTGTCRSLWDDSSAFKRDDLNLMFKVQTRSRYSLSTTSSKSKTNVADVAIATRTDFTVEHPFHLFVGEVSIEIFDVDPIRNDLIGSFTFNFKDISTDFETECLSGSAKITNSHFTELINAYQNTLKSGDHVILSCLGENVLAKINRFEQSNSVFYEDILMLDLSILTKENHHCIKDLVYAKNLKSTEPAIEVLSLNGYSVGNLVLATIAGEELRAVIRKIYSNGFIELDYYLHDYQGDFSPNDAVINKIIKL